MARLEQLAVLVSCFIVTYTFPKGSYNTTISPPLMSNCSQDTTKELSEEHKVVNDATSNTTGALGGSSSKDPDSSEGSVFSTQHLAQVKNNPCKDGYFRDWNNMCRKLD